MSPAPDLKLPPDAPPWMRRHPRWVIAGGTAILLLIVLFVVGVFANLINLSFRHAAPYRQAVALAQADPRVIAALGAPIEEARWIEGRFDNGDNGRIDVSVGLRGSRKRGRLYVSGDKRLDRWTLSARVDVEGEPGRIDLPTR